MQLANKHMKRFSALLIIREVQIKVTVSSHTCQKGYYQKKTTNINNKYWPIRGEKVTLTHCSWDCKLAQPLWKKKYEVSSKLKTELPYDPAISLLGIYLKNKNENSNSKRCAP